MFATWVRKKIVIRKMDPSESHGRPLMSIVGRFGTRRKKKKSGYNIKPARGARRARLGADAESAYMRLLIPIRSSYGTHVSQQISCRPPSYCTSFVFFTLFLAPTHTHTNSRLSCSRQSSRRSCNFVSYVNLSTVRWWSYDDGFWSTCFLLWPRT
jgi:hypothetical protein